MKKYMLLALCTAVALAAIFGIRQYTGRPRATVTVTELQATAVRRTVECTGKIQASKTQDVFVSVPCVAGTVYVKEGQRVKQGEALFAVDTEATMQVLSQLGASAVAPVSTVTAPVSGVVKSMRVTTGGVAAPETPCAVIAVDGGVRVAIVIREKHLSRVSVGQTAEISGVAFNKERYHGTVTHIADTAHQEYVGAVSATVVDAVISLDEGEADDSLRSGLNARATVVTEVLEDVLLVPYGCIAQNGEGEEYVYVYRDDGTAVRTVPVWGEDCADGVLVLSGLSAGDRLVQNPETLAGDTVQVWVE